MKEYILLFRMNILTESIQPTKEQMAAYMSQWMHWINEIADKGQLASGGNHLSRTGKVIRPQNEIINEPYAVNMESVAGYIIILAKNMDDASEIAKRCPILNGKGTSVEIREAATPGT